MEKRKTKVLKVIVSMMILLVVAFVISCSDLITTGKLENTIGEVTDAYSFTFNYLVKGNSIAQDEMVFFNNLIIKSKDLALKDEIFMSINAILHDLNLTRGSNSFENALGFINDHWSLVEEEKLSSEALIGLSGLIIDDVLSYDDCSTIARDENHDINITIDETGEVKIYLRCGACCQIHKDGEKCPVMEIFTK